MGNRRSAECADAMVPFFYRKSSTFGRFVWVLCTEIDTKKGETNWTSCGLYDIIIYGILDT